MLLSQLCLPPKNFRWKASTKVFMYLLKSECFIRKKKNLNSAHIRHQKYYSFTFHCSRGSTCTTTMSPFSARLRATIPSKNISRVSSCEQKKKYFELNKVTEAAKHDVSNSFCLMGGHANLQETEWKLHCTSWGLFWADPKDKEKNNQTIFFR